MAICMVCRHSYSTTQGCASLWYDGKLIKTYGDKIELIGKTWHSTIKDEAFLVAAKREDLIPNDAQLTGIPKFGLYCMWRGSEELPVDTIEEAKQEARRRSQESSLEWEVFKVNKTDLWS